MRKELEKAPRYCSVTGDGMWEGWVWGDGAFYTSTEELTHAECIKDRNTIVEMTLEEELPYNEIDDWDRLRAKAKSNPDALTGAELLELGYAVDYVYYTDWCEDDMYDDEEE